MVDSELVVMYVLRVQETVLGGVEVQDAGERECR